MLFVAGPTMQSEEESTMVMSTCYECGDTVSSLADCCPHCGAPMQDKIIHAVRMGNLQSVRELLQAGSDVNTKTEDGLTALIVACRQGHTLVMEELLSQGADIFVEDNNGWTPLMWAAATGHAPAVRMLLERGVELEARDQVRSHGIDESLPSRLFGRGATACGKRRER